MGEQHWEPEWIFRQVWREQSRRLGCGEVAGAEYRRVLALWLAAGQPPHGADRRTQAMKALTVCQPYAHLIAQADDWTHPIHGECKRVENRTWSTNHRGPLAIHAGVSRKFMQDGDAEDFPDMPFGAVVAVAKLRDCVRLPPEWKQHPEHDFDYRLMVKRWPWLLTHRHTEGPCCWVLAEVRVLPRPVPCKGLMHVWDLPADVLAAVEAQLAGGPKP